MLRVLLGKDLEAAQSIIAREGKAPIATIEAEYGSTVVEGAKATYAHHVQGYTTAPSLQANNSAITAEDIMDSSNYILVSHIDLDVICGILSILNAYDVRDAVKEAVNFVDCNGQHNLFKEVSEEARRVILAYIGYASRNRCPQQEDITEYVQELIQSFFTQDNYEAGLALVEGRKKAASEYLTAAVGNVALLDQPESSNIFGLNAEYIIDDVEYDYIIVFNRKFGSITMSSKAGVKGEKNMATIMKAVFGEEAGGHKGIAGTPRGKSYSLEDATNLLDVVSRIV